MAKWRVIHKVNLETHLLVEADTAGEARRKVENLSNCAIHAFPWVKQYGLACVKSVQPLEKGA